MVPLRFQTPIRAPTANRMKIALVTEATAPLPASWTAPNEWPFFIAISAASAQHSSSATWIGPSSASSP